jgi:hypothetical protein
MKSKVERDTELLKIQAYEDYVNSNFGSGSSYVLGAIVAYYISVMGFYIQRIIDLGTYYVLLFLPLPVFVVLLFSTYRTHTKQLIRVDLLIEKLNKGEPIPSVEDMIKGKAWKT